MTTSILAELVGVLATSTAAVSAKPPSAPCGGTSSLLLLPLRVLPVWRGNAGGLALGTCMLSRVTSFCWSLQSSSVAFRFVGFVRGVSGAGPGVAFPWRAFAR